VDVSVAILEEKDTDLEQRLTTLRDGLNYFLPRGNIQIKLTMIILMV